MYLAAAHKPRTPPGRSMAPVQGCAISSESVDPDAPVQIKAVLLLGRHRVERAWVVARTPARRESPTVGSEEGHTHAGHCC